MKLNQLTDDLIAAYAELRRFLLRRLGNADDAADVAQSSFERAYAYAITSPVTSPRALLFRTARSVCIDQGRRRRIEARVFQALDAADAPLVASAERAFAGGQAIERILARLARLPRKRREAFVLVRVYGHTHAEAAAKMGVTVTAIAKHVVRATLDCSDLFVALSSE